MSALPSGWVEVELGDVFGRRRGSALAPAKQPGQRFELYSVPAFQIGQPECPLGAEVGSSKQTVTPGTVLLCRINPRINRVWLVGESADDPQIASTEWIALRRVEGVVPRFLMYALRTPAVRGHLTSNVLGVGGSLMRVRMAAAWQTKVPLPPLPEQHRIVTKIEPMLARLDEGIAALKRTESNLERYRSSILKAAIEGRLTEQWRKENPPEETGKELLQRILDERRKQWEKEQLARFKAKERKPPKDWKAQYKDPMVPNTEKLPRLPEGWCWATIDQFASTACGGTPDRQNESYFGGGIPWVKSGELKDGPVLLSAETISTRGMASSNAKMFPAGTLCIALYGATVGKLGLLGMDATTNQAVCGILRPIAALPEYLYFALRATRPHLIRSGKGGAQSNISQQVVRSTPVALPPLMEQEAIITILNARFSAVQQISERLLGSCLLTAPQLRQSILKCAFEGRLVPQNPHDEPASVLLERIRSKRESEQKRGSTAT